MHFLSHYHSLFSEEATGAQRGDFPKVIAGASVKIQIQVCLTPPPGALCDISLWVLSLGLRRDRKARQGWGPLGRSPRGLTFRWPDDNLGAPCYTTQLPFNPGPPSCFFQVPCTLFSPLLVPPCVVPLPRPQNHSQEKTISVVTKWVKFVSANSLYQLIPKRPSPWVFKNTHMHVHTSTHTPEWHLCLEKRKNETAALGANFANSYPLERKQEVFYTHRIGHCISESLGVQRKPRKHRMVWARVSVKKRRESQRCEGRRMAMEGGINGEKPANVCLLQLDQHLWP